MDELSWRGWGSDRKNVGADSRPVQRTALLYTKDQHAVRLEVLESAGVLRLIVFGPGTAYHAFDFPNGKSLTEYQTTYERELLESGFQLQAIAERRRSADRRARPRDDKDRRR